MAPILFHGFTQFGLPVVCVGRASGLRIRYPVENIGSSLKGVGKSEFGAG